MNRKKVIRKIAIILLVLIILFIIIVGIVYYYLTTEYSKEYNIEYVSYSSEFDYNIALNNFTTKVLTYSEYVSYCNYMNLEINYSNEECNYIIMKGLVASNFELNNIIYFNNKTIILWSYSIPWEVRNGLVAEDYVLMPSIIIIPTTHTINDLNIFNVTTLSEILEYVLMILIVFTIVCIIIIICLLKKKN